MITLRSPAKINLDFKIVGKRADGYHLIQSNMQAIDLFDELSIRIGKKNRLIVDSHVDLKFETSIFQKSFDLLTQKGFHIPQVEIILKKNIPIGAGLGGGSSNAATFLWAINYLFNLQIDEQELQHLSASLGADVPFFFSSGSAYVEGIGTTVTSLSNLKKGKNYTLIFCDTPLLTKEVFSKVNLDDLIDTDRNALEKFACKSSSKFKLFYDEIKLYYKDAFMTGSGSTMVVENATEKVLLNYKSLKVNPVYKNENSWYGFSFS